jgi:transposase-like protein
MDMTAKIYTDEIAARKHLETLLWPEGPVCPHCASQDAATALKGKSTRPGVYWCNPCQKPFSVTVGTVMESSHIPLNKWLLATALLTSSKKGMSAHQLMRVVGLGSYRSAWFMAHRIREAMAPKEGSEPPLGGEGQVVEADETELGISTKTRSRRHGRKSNLKFVSLVERGGRVRSRKITGSKYPMSVDIHAALRGDVDPASTLHTDGAKHYKQHYLSHESVDHNKQFVRKGKGGQPVHCNSAEGFFSIFKRGLVGTYQHMSEQHLPRYLADFDFRMSHRAKLGIDDATRAEIALKGTVGKRLTYRRTNQTSQH